MKNLIQWTIVMALAACRSSTPAPATPPVSEPAPPPMAERKAMSQEACVTGGGSVVGDIGDGATQRPDYICPSGKAPLGNIAPPSDGPRPVEGGVCCPR